MNPSRFNQPVEWQLREVREIVDRCGQAVFVDRGVSGRRLCYKLRDRLPPAYEAVIEDPYPLAGGPGALLRFFQREVRLWVRRIGGPSRQPRTEDPHQRTLGSLNGSVLPEEEEAGG